MTDSTMSSEPGLDTTNFGLMTGAQAEQALRSTIQRLERLGDCPLDLAQALVKLGALRQEKGNHSEAEDLFRNALNISERTLGSDHIELVPVLTSLGSARMLRGSAETAEPFLNRALTISTRYLGEDHPDLVIMVNDIARLYLKHGAYPFAEPLLQRLLSMKRSKGDDHPEVATVLASLAAVRQARGQHESAEELWRRVLAIRERTLAPNHFAQATALEHLAGVCSARGKVGEALELFQRAQVIREMTLGSDHSSLRVLRERIADLQLQASEDSFDVPYVRPADPRPDDLRPAYDLGINTRAARRPTRETRRRARTESAVPVVDRELPRPSATNDEETPPTARAAPTDNAEEREAAALAYRAALLEERQNADETDEGEGVGLVIGLFAPVIALARKNRGEVLAVTGVVAFLAIALAASTRASTETDQAIADPPSVAAVSLPVVGPQPLTETKDQLKVPAPISATPTPTRVITPVRSRAVEQRNLEKVSERRAELPRISIPTVSSTMTNRVDSLVRAAGAPKGILSETILVPGTLSTATLQRSGFDYLDPEKPQGSHVRLIGSLPQPRYTNPDVEGEVLVNFGVDAAGHPEMGTFSVVNSRNEFLTAAIRKVIEGLRFEPARTAAPESKPIAERVQIRFVFARSTR
jgi:tetratricopeptide (TPR) repeat protein